MCDRSIDRTLRSRVWLVGTILFFALSTTGSLFAQYELVKVVTERQKLMFEMQTAYWPLLAVKNGKSSDLPAAAAASQSIGNALRQFSELLLSGTAKGDVPGSRAEPAIWTEPADFAAALSELQTAAEALSDVASSGDLDLFKARFDAFADACVGCHGFKPSSGGRFRAAPL